jgi:ABC-type transporter Mla subunit MlaD
MTDQQFDALLDAIKELTKTIKKSSDYLDTNFMTLNTILETIESAYCRANLIPTAFELENEEDEDPE